MVESMDRVSGLMGGDGGRVTVTEKPLSPAEVVCVPLNTTGGTASK